jgi:hypothetical protein
LDPRSLDEYEDVMVEGMVWNLELSLMVIDLICSMLMQMARVQESGGLQKDH